MFNFRSTAAIAFATSLSIACASASAQDAVSPSEPPIGSSLATGDLERLVAPIALYPDVLIAQVLPACTFPMDIVRAARWLRSNPDLNTLADQPWDSSVIALCNYPDVIYKLDADLDWAESLGAAFLNQPDVVMDAIQAVRGRAQSTGVLQTTPQQTVIEDAGSVVIVPTEPEVIYVPQYDPQIVYVYDDVDYRYATPVYTSAVVGFSTGWYLGSWLDLDCDWGGRCVSYCYPGYWRGYYNVHGCHWRGGYGYIGHGWHGNNWHGHGWHGKHPTQHRGGAAWDRHGSRWARSGSKGRPNYSGDYFGSRGSRQGAFRGDQFGNRTGGGRGDGNRISGTRSGSRVGGGRTGNSFIDSNTDYGRGDRSSFGTSRNGRGSEFGRGFNGSGQSGPRTRAFDRGNTFGRSPTETRSEQGRSGPGRSGTVRRDARPSPSSRGDARTGGRTDTRPQAGNGSLNQNSRGPSSIGRSPGQSPRSTARPTPRSSGGSRSQPGSSGIRNPGNGSRGGASPSRSGGISGRGGASPSRSGGIRSGGSSGGIRRSSAPSSSRGSVGTGGGMSRGGGISRSGGTSRSGNVSRGGSSSRGGNVSRGGSISRGGGSRGAISRGGGGGRGGRR